MEALVLVVDVAATGADGGFLAETLQCCDRILQRKLFADKCKDHVALVLVGTEDTENALHDADEQQYQHVRLARRLAPVDWPLVRCLQEDVGAEQAAGDWLDGLVVAMDHVHQCGQVHKYADRRLLLFTDFTGPLCTDQLDTIVTRLGQMQVELTLIGAELGDDADGADNGAGEPQPGPSGLSRGSKPATQQQLAGEDAARQLLKATDGESFSFQQALPQLLLFQERSARSAPWHAPLEIGSDLTINVTGYIQVKKATMPTWKKVAVSDGAPVRRATTLEARDSSGATLAPDDTVRAFRYGTALVPLDTETGYSSGTPRSLQVLGFTAATNVPRHLYVDTQTVVIVARNGDAGAAAALSALIHALQETDMVAVARRTYNGGNVPRLGALLPLIRHTHECLVFVHLPFAEDVRNAMFAPLPAPTAAHEAAVDRLIDTMDMSAGPAAELLEPGALLSPQFQRLYQALSARALRPGAALPPVPVDLLQQLSPEPALRLAAADAVAALAAACPLQEVTQPHQRRDTGRDVFAPVSDSAAAATATPAAAAVTRVGTVNPVEDFLNMLRGEQVDVTEACAQMQRVVLQLADESAELSALAEKAVAALVCLRERCVLMAPTAYSGWVRQQRPRLQRRPQVWLAVVQRRLGPVLAAENPAADGLPDEEAAFYAEAAPLAPVTEQEDAADDDLLDDL